MAERKPTAGEGIKDNTVRIYTDGSVPLGNPGPGGWAALLDYRGHRLTLCGFHEKATNNQMEMRGVIEGLKHLSRPCRVVVYTDSQYVQKGMSLWLPRWKHNGWRNATGSKVKNYEIWQELVEAEARHISVVYRWVKGHAGHPENEYVDRVACRVVMEKVGMVRK